MSTVAFIRRCLAAGMDVDTAMIAAEAFEAATLKRAAPPRPAPPAKADDQVWVYVMTEDGPEMPLVKVGISKHPNWRRIELEKEARTNLYIAHTQGPFSTRSEALEVERLAHAALAATRQWGEWFLVPEERAIEVVRNISRQARA